jgi:hypothetical protein
LGAMASHLSVSTCFVPSFLRLSFYHPRFLYPIMLDTMTCQSSSAFARVLSGDPVTICTILWGRKTPANSLRDNAPCSANGRVFALHCCDVKILKNANWLFF